MVWFACSLRLTGSRVAYSRTLLKLDLSAASIQIRLMQTTLGRPTRIESLWPHSAGAAAAAAGTSITDTVALTAARRGPG